MEIYFCLSCLNARAELRHMSCRVAFGYMSAALNLIFALMLLLWRDKDAEALDRVALTHSEA